MGQSNLRTGPPVAVDGRSLYHFMSSQKFFEALPPSLEDWQADAREARTKMAKHVLENKDACFGCLLMTTVMAAVLQALAARLQVMHKIDPHVTDALVGFIADRQGYLPKYVLMYYKDKDGKVTPFKF